MIFQFGAPVPVGGKLVRTGNAEIENFSPICFGFRSAEFGPRSSFYNCAPVSIRSFWPIACELARLNQRAQFARCEPLIESRDRRVEREEETDRGRDTHAHESRHVN